MTTDTDTQESPDTHEPRVDEHGDGHGDEHGELHVGHIEHGDVFYVKIAFFLAFLTGIEVLLSYSDVGPLFLPAMFTLMSVKFVMVVLFFMHLRFDSKWFNMAFWAGLGLAIGVYSVALMTFKFFLAP
jgi:cytochrome c oxidase subunit IV